MEIFQDRKLLNKAFQPVDAEASLQGRVVGIYFSASWCPPCQQFTPILAEFHKAMQARQAQFQIVYVPFDKSEDEMREYVQGKHGSWLLVPFKDKLIEELKTQFNISVIPKLVIVKPDGEILTLRGRKEVTDRGVSAFRSWSAAAFGLQPSSKAAILQAIDVAVAASKVTEQSKEDKDVPSGRELDVIKE